MKNLSSTLALIIGILVAGKLTVLAQDITGHTVMIVQTPIDKPGFQYVMYPDSDSGAAEILFPISDNGDVFQLWVTGTAWDDAVYMLDSKVVNAYSPAGKFVVTSEDPWVVGDINTGNYIKRTRADRPYGVDLTVTGLSADVTAPDSAKSVRLDHIGVNYDTSGDPVTYSALGAKPYTISSNKITNIAPWTQNNDLTPLGSTKVCGEERWELVRWADLNTDGTVLVPETTINNVTVQVWPMSDATLEGLVDGQEVLDSIPSLSVQLKDVYPDSYTYCQIYKGTQVTDTVGTIIPGSEMFYGQTGTATYNAKHSITAGYTSATVEPQNPDKFFIDLNAVAPADGVYTIEVITETPFGDKGTLAAPVWGPMLLKWITFKVNRRTAIRATLSSGN